MNLSDPANLLIAGIYYVIVGIMSFFSIFAVYILMRYGRSTLLAFAFSIFYIFIFVSLLGNSYQALQTLLQ